MAILMAWYAMPPRASAQEPVLPLAPPDAANGLEIYANRCANCHGPTGAGDGEMAARLPMAPRALNDPTYRQTAEPAEMYAIITNGNLEAGMPPFGPASSNPIPEPARWDLVAAVYSLSTPQETLERGEDVYAANCQACHGASGAGDGPDAASTTTPPTNLTDVGYWFNRSNATVFTALQDEAIPEHTYTLSDDEIWDVVDYSRTFSFLYADPLAEPEPIPAATIRGAVDNGTTGASVTEGEVRVRAFTPAFQEVFSDTTTLEADGRYSIELTNVSPEWVFFTSIEYGDLSFSSDPNQISRGAPELELPITVFEGTDDAGVVNIEQVHTILEFPAADRLRVNQLYIFNNNAQAVFMGKSGNPDDGTLELVLPAGAENPNFQRAFNSPENFLPADEIVQTERGWADTLPLRPGQPSMVLLASYELPYTDGMRVAHPVNYDVTRTTLILPEAGVTLAGDSWSARGAQQMGNAGTVLSYAGPELAQGEALSMVLNGRPRASTAPDAAGLLRDETTELIIGFTVLTLALVGVVFAVRRWQQAPQPETADSQVLLRTIANLDDAYAAGALPEEEYQAQRQKLIAEVAAQWQQSE